MTENAIAKEIVDAAFRIHTTLTHALGSQRSHESRAFGEQFRFFKLGSPGVVRNVCQ